MMLTSHQPPKTPSTPLQHIETDHQAIAQRLGVTGDRAPPATPRVESTHASEPVPGEDERAFILKQKKTRKVTKVMQDSSPDGATSMNATHEIGHEGNVTRSPAPSSSPRPRRKKNTSAKKTATSDNGRTGGARMAPQNTDNRFEQFQQHEAMGMFSVLADSDSEADEAVNAMQVDEAGLDQSCPLTPEQEEAPYAYPQKEDEETKDDRVHGFEEGEQAQTIVQRTGSVDDVAMTQVTDDEDGTAEHRTTPAEENAGTEEDIKPSKALEVQSATAVVRAARKAKQQLGKVGLQAGAKKACRQTWRLTSKIKRPSK
ncbi:hypothetical protein GN958_ATG11976 [Phytophthora infestans]|uniref:Uncharacterized protein n=1 Tax=Phytophthora infestans TaxID=4787 RepID=A0A8S9UH38_PHYIN|nr:hypothetical protein GN958_ATG11976 [Phytophthora infestans]